jgi:PhoPQ-activated pathogenicity-related protein
MNVSRAGRMVGCVATLAMLVALAAPIQAGTTLLDDYIAAVDESFQWTLTGTTQVPAEPPYTRYTIEFTSQTWRGNAWTHNLLVFVPEVVDHPETVMLVIGGGVNRTENGPPRGAATPEAFIVPPIATRGRAIVALLSQVPNQPILGGLDEDAAIAHSFVQYLTTGEGDWPLLLPMTKSAVRAMDALEAFLKEQIDVEVEQFMLTGASKRGWTTWLTAAVDSRVAAIAPLVIDNLNLPAQMTHQIASWGAYSDSISDYTERGWQEEFSGMTERGRTLLEAIDPYYYMDRLQIPKLVQSGTNDPYWVVDASRFYFPELEGEKYLHFSPNTGHDVDLGGVMTIGGFFHFVRTGQARPTFSWEVSEAEAGEQLTVVHNDRPERVRLWTADSPVRDFRGAEWTSREIEHGEGSRYEAAVERPLAGYRAYYAELVYTVEDDVTMGFCTEMRVVGPAAGEE